MAEQNAYENLIMKGIKGLPQEVLAEVADFVYFVRTRVTQPQFFENTVALPHSGTEAPPSWLNLAGSISLADLDTMKEAIEAECEQVDADAW